MTINARILGYTAALAFIGIAVIAVVGCQKNPAAPVPAQPIIIGHQADLSGGISSWGYWLDKAAKAAVDQVNKEGGIDGRQVKYVVEDTETDPSTGRRKLQKLIQQHKADFVLGSTHSGVMMASLPLALELETPYFPVAMASEATGPEANRFVFRINSHVREQVQASADWVVNGEGGPLAKKWTIVVADYAWGISHEEWFGKGVEAAGGEIVKRIRVPQGTKDFVPYVSKIPADTEAVYFIFFGADSLGFIQQLHESGYSGEKYSVVCTMEAIDIASLGAAAEGMWVLEYLPREMNQEKLPKELRDSFENRFHVGFRETIAVDDDGKEIGNPDRVVACSHCWATFQLVHMLKDAIEESGWKSRKDNNKLITSLEGRKLGQSMDYPQGENEIRAEDHQGFHQHWMSKVVDGKLSVKFRIDKDKVTYAPSVDLR